MRSFGTEGRVRPEQHYIVPRTEEITDFIQRVKNGKYIVRLAQILTTELDIPKTEPITMAHSCGLQNPTGAGYAARIRGTTSPTYLSGPLRSERGRHLVL